MSTPPGPAAPAPRTPDDLRAELATELRWALRDLVAFGDGGAQAHEYAGGQLLTLLWGRAPHLCRSRCSANTGPFACSPGTPPHLAGMTRRPVDGTGLLAPADFGAGKTLAQRVHFEYLREVAQPGIEAIWAWLAAVVERVDARAAAEALADVAAADDDEDRYARHACAGWSAAVAAYGPHPDGFTVVTTTEAAGAGLDHEEAGPGGQQPALAPGVRPYAVCDVTDAYGAAAASALAAARANRKYARLRGRRSTGAVPPRRP